MLVSGTTPDLFSFMALPRATWTSAVTGMDLVSTDDAAAEVRWGQLGLMENRLVLCGDMVVYGFKTSQLPGETYAAKREYLIQTSPMELTRMVSVGGFKVKFKDGVTQDGSCIVSIPTGYVIVTAACNCSYLRWSFCGDDRDRTRVQQALQEILDSFPDLKGTAGYADFGRFLGCRV